MELRSYSERMVVSPDLHWHSDFGAFSWMGIDIREWRIENGLGWARWGHLGERKRRPVSRIRVKSGISNTALTGGCSRPSMRFLGHSGRGFLLMPVPR